MIMMEIFVSCTSWYW